MNTIDQHEAMISLEQALVPAPSLIDGRTEQDWLCFLSDFASLINFYDKNNHLNGNWTPFLLKDPVFLLAIISKTKVAELHSLYRNTCSKLESLIALKTDTADITVSFNQLFDQIVNIFMHIKRWIHFMQRSTDEYDLKTFIIHQVRNKYSKYFWAIISLRQNLYLSSAIRGIQPVDTGSFYLFEPYEEIIWKQNKDKSPYWEILHLKHPIKENTIPDFFNAMVKAGNNVFSFFHTIVKQSVPEFEKLKAKKSTYPDTLLLRAFVDLLKVYQDQLNGISHKHLRFYYKDILKQADLPAVADKVFICAELAKNNAAFNLPAGTLFNAGLDTQKNPISFVNPEAVSLNPATITGAYTLTALPGPNNLSSLYLQATPAPGVVQTDPDGKVQTWNTFGSSIPSPASLTQLGIAFASPMLLLREGQRTISLHLQFAGSIDMQLLQNARYYLSTQKDWLEVTSTVTFPPVTPVAANAAIINIAINPSQPPIEPFLKNPDGLSSPWAMIKIEFTSFPNLPQPPVLTKMQIGVKVSNVKTFQLYNDNGALSTKMPYAIFGPIPLVNSHFIIGNNEIFSKPFDSLFIEMDWSNLPDSFLSYYQQYNDYLADQQAEQNNVPLSRWQRFKLWLRRLFGHKPPPPPPNNTPFNNVCFTVDFNLLQNHTWQNLSMTKQQDFIISATNDITADPYQNDAGCVPPAGQGNLLFSTQSTANSNCTLTGSSYFSYNVSSTPILIIDTPDPSIQNTPLVFTDASASGFMNMVLAAPLYGFGSEIYPNVVSYIALQNALSISKSNDKNPPELIQPAKIPFAPKVVNLIAHYTASQTYDLTLTTGTYPIQSFLYTPFANFMVYDNTQSPSAYDNGFATSITSTGKITNGIPLFTSFEYNGALFLQMDNVVAPNTLQLYFQLAPNYGASSTARIVEYHYLSNTGWKELPVLSESTNQLTCPGLIKVNIPTDITTQNAVMPGNKYWISIAVKNNPSAFAQTVFLKTNGFAAQRSGTNFLTAAETPQIPALTITKPSVATPQIATLIQPFPSFGGKPAENHAQMHQRVSCRLKTKDRAVSAEDYARLIRQEHPDIYYSKPVYDPSVKNITVYVVKGFESWLDPNAFTPLISECKQESIQTYLTKRASAFASISVSNFRFQYVQVTATVSVKTGFDNEGMIKKINHSLNIFLSPWISSTGPQIAIDTSISDAEVAAFIESIQGVAGADGISFQTWTIDDQTGQKQMIGDAAQTILYPGVSTLFVSSMNHNIALN